MANAPKQFKEMLSAHDFFLTLLSRVAFAHCSVVYGFALV